MFYIGYGADGTFSDDGCLAINCLRLVGDVEKHGNLTERKWKVQTLKHENLKGFAIGRCDDITALLFTCQDGIPRLVEYIKRDFDPIEPLKHSKSMWKIKVKCQGCCMPIDIPCANETVCFVYLETLANQLEKAELLINDLRLLPATNAVYS